MDINTLVQYKELDEAIKWLQKLKPGIYEFEEKYIVLKEFSYKGRVYKRGDSLFLKPSKFSATFLKVDTTHKGKENSIRKIKQYIDFRSPQMRDVEFNESYTKIKVY